MLRLRRKYFSETGRVAVMDMAGKTVYKYVRSLGVGTEEETCGRGCCGRLRDMT